MTHPLVLQLHFTRSEWQRALAGLTDDDARHRFEPMNSISWMLGHLAWHEHLYWCVRGQGKDILPQLDPIVGYQQPASTPPLADMWAAWHTAIEASDPYLATLTSEIMQTHMRLNGEPHEQSIGTMLQRVIYHYWFHTGEVLAIRQILGHKNLPEFVGEIQAGGPYRPEA